VALYGEGMSIAEFSRKFGLHQEGRRALRPPFSAPTSAGALSGRHARAERLYEIGLTRVKVGLRFGVSQQAARRAVAAEALRFAPAADGR